MKAELYKLCSISLCSNTVGQIATGLMVQPPQPGDASYATYVAERDGILSSLRRRAGLLSQALNALQGVSCNSIDGALYAFPTITLPGNKPYFIVSFCCFGEVLIRVASIFGAQSTI